MSSTYTLSAHIRRTSKTLIKEGQFNWLRYPNKLKMYKSGLKEWVGHLQEYLKKADISTREKGIVSGEILRFNGTIRNINRVLSNKY